MKLLEKRQPKIYLLLLIIAQYITMISTTLSASVEITTTPTVKTNISLASVSYKCSQADGFVTREQKIKECLKTWIEKTDKDIEGTSFKVIIPGEEFNRWEVITNADENGVYLTQNNDPNGACAKPSKSMISNFLYWPEVHYTLFPTPTYNDNDDAHKVSTIKTRLQSFRYDTGFSNKDCSDGIFQISHFIICPSRIIRGEFFPTNAKNKGDMHKPDYRTTRYIQVVIVNQTKIQNETYHTTEVYDEINIHTVDYILNAILFNETEYTNGLDNSNDINSIGLDNHYLFLVSNPKNVNIFMTHILKKLGMVAKPKKKKKRQGKKNTRDAFEMGTIAPSKYSITFLCPECEVKIQESTERSLLSVTDLASSDTNKICSQQKQHSTKDTELDSAVSVNNHTALNNLKEFPSWSIPQNEHSTFFDLQGLGHHVNNTTVVNNPNRASVKPRTYAEAVEPQIQLLRLKQSEPTPTTQTDDREVITKRKSRIDRKNRFKTP